MKDPRNREILRCAQNDLVSEILRLCLRMTLKFPVLSFWDILYQSSAFSLRFLQRLAYSVYRFLRLTPYALRVISRLTA
jgi:hypothetical protein